MYNEILLDHHNHPQLKGELENENFCKTLENSSCGDRIEIKLKLAGDKIEDARWDGVGCAVSQASADMMLELFIGKTKAEAEELIQLFSDLLKGEEKDYSALGDAVVFESFAKNPTRSKCAYLSWKIAEEW